MKTLIAIAVVVISVGAHAQINTSDYKHARSFFSMFSFKKNTFTQFAKTTPSFTTLPINNSAQTTSGYWMGSSYSSYSDDGRLQSSHSFDVLGNLRESKASISLRKKGNLSHWRLQISPQRNRPWVSYTIQ